METILLVITILIIIVVIAVHIRPLTDEQIIQLSNKRRQKNIRAYYMLDTREYEVSKEFKKKMKPDGAFYNINESLYKFPATAAALLKYKKHEWIIIAFKKNKVVELCWLNKGFDKSAVAPYLSYDDVCKIAKDRNTTSILIFHNHPASNPEYYRYDKPSKRDIITARELSLVLNNNDINLVEFVCERGRHYKYFLSSADTFYPLNWFKEELKTVNGSSVLKNMALHFERIF